MLASVHAITASVRYIAVKGSGNFHHTQLGMAPSTPTHMPKKNPYRAASLSVSLGIFPRIQV